MFSSVYAADRLLWSNDLTYLGAFTMTDLASRYGGTALGFNPNGNGGAGSLVLNAFYRLGTILEEISIPTSLYNGDVNDFSATTGIKQPQHLATYVSPNNVSPYYWDVSEEHSHHVGENGADLTSKCSLGWGAGGIYIDGTTAYVTSYCLYPGAGQVSVMPLLTHSTSLSTTGSYRGQYALNIYTTAFPRSVGKVGDIYSGALGGVPSAYQAQLGGKILAGSLPFQGSIIQRFSYGPSLTIFDPANFAAQDTFPASQNGMMLVSYPFMGGHNTLNPDTYHYPNQYIAPSDYFGGIIFPPNNRSVLVFGQHGLGNPRSACGAGFPTSGYSCYGQATNTCSEACMASTSNNPWGLPICRASFTCGGVQRTSGNCCYDPSRIGQTQGPSAWPYTGYIWAYDVGDSSGNNTTGNNVPSQPSTVPAHRGNTTRNNLTAVKLGYVNPWDLYPYSVWSLPKHYSRDVNHGFGDGAANGSNGCYGGATYDPKTGKLYIGIFHGQPPNYAMPVFEVYQITVGGSYVPFFGIRSEGAKQ
jgi:hypothetical protein